MTASPLISIPDTSASSYRFIRAIGNLNRFAADPTRGASVESIRAAIIRDEVPPAKDLVALLIQDEREIWNMLLQNTFCKAMGEAPPGDEKVTRGFKWYMVQDFWYCAKLMLFDTEQASKVSSRDHFEKQIGEIKSHSDYALIVLDTCIKDLDIQDEKVLEAKIEEATEAYTSFSYSIARDEKDWVRAAVAMVPCMQSYYRLAKQLESSCPDTLWYKYWVEPNLEYEEACMAQRAFFVENFEHWKDPKYYNDLRKIFKNACQHEIDLWAVGDHPPSDVEPVPYAV